MPTMIEAACLGTIVGIWADKWDQQQGIENFVVLPLTFLSGTFYSISLLPDFWKNLSHYNPFFYNIDGFRYAFIGYSDSSILKRLSLRAKMIVLPSGDILAQSG